MKSIIFAAIVALAVPTAYAQLAQELPGFPTCAVACVEDASPVYISGCSQTDIGCLCGSASFLTAVGTCVHSSCTPPEEKATLDAAYKLCEANGVIIPTTAPTTYLPTETTETTVAPETTSTPVTYTTTTTEVSTVVTIDTTEVPYPVTTLTTTTFYGTGSVTQTFTRNISNPTVVPPPANSEGAAVKNIAGLGAMAMAVAGFFAM